MPHVQMQPQNTQNFKKNAFMICLCYSHMFRCSYKNQKTPKKCIHDICLCYPCMFRCCIKGRESVPSVISKEHLPTSAAYSQPPVQAIILTCAKYTRHNLVQKMQKLACQYVGWACANSTSKSLCKFRKYSPTDWAQNQSLVSITTLRYSKIHHL